MNFETKNSGRWIGYVALGAVAALGFGLVLHQRRLRTLPEVHFPIVRPPVPNAYGTWVAAGRACKPSQVPVDAALDDRALPLPTADIAFRRVYSPQVRTAWLQANAPAIALVHLGLHEKYLHPLVLDSHASLRYFADIRRGAGALAAQCHAQQARGDYAGAATSALDLVQMGDELPRGAPLIVAREGSGIAQLGRNALWQLLPKLDANTTRQASERLTNISAGRPKLASSLRVEKWMGQALLLEMMSRGTWQQSFYVGVPPLQFWWQTRSMNYRTIARDHAAFFDGLIAASTQPAGVPTDELPPAYSPADPFMVRVAGLFLQARPMWALYQADEALLRTALALQEFHLANGRYPANIDELAKGSMKSVPLDPFGQGEPLHYVLRRTAFRQWQYRPLTGPAAQPGQALEIGKPVNAETEYTLYSVGPDGEDNNGHPIDNTETAGDAATEVGLFSAGDMVAGINRAEG